MYQAFMYLSLNFRLLKFVVYCGFWDLSIFLPSLQINISCSMEGTEFWELWTCIKQCFGGIFLNSCQTDCSDSMKKFASVSGIFLRFAIDAEGMFSGLFWQFWEYFRLAEMRVFGSISCQNFISRLPIMTLCHSVTITHFTLSHRQRKK